MSTPITPPRSRDLVMCGPHSLPPTPAKPHYTTYLTEEIRKYRNYLDHSDPGVRLVGLHAIYEALDSLFAQENAPMVYAVDAAPQPEPHWVRELVRRFLS